MSKKDQARSRVPLQRWELIVVAVASSLLIIAAIIWAATFILFLFTLMTQDIND